MGNFWLWLIVGLLPYSIHVQKVKGDRIVKIRAIFWLLSLCVRKSGCLQWKLYVPLIEHMRK